MKFSKIIYMLVIIVVAFINLPHPSVGKCYDPPGVTQHKIWNAILGETHLGVA